PRRAIARSMIARCASGPRDHTILVCSPESMILRWFWDAGGHLKKFSLFRDGHVVRKTDALKGIPVARTSPR
ncbi:MAG: hypothetical protein ACRD3W_27420, partial [Terriglobales bacterium]